MHIRLLAALVLFGCLFFAACGTTVTVTAGGTALPAVTATPAGPPTLAVKPITASAVNAVCPDFAQPTDTIEQVGDLALDITGNIALGYANYLLPDSLATDTPYVTDNGHHMASPAVNPSLANGYAVNLCNLSSSATVVLQGVGIKVASQATASTAQKNIASSNCAEFFQLPNSITGGGCGGALGPHTAFTATWPGTVSVGSAVTTAQTSTDPGTFAGPKDAFGPLPISIKPGDSLGMFIGMTSYPAPDATYTFAMGVQVSGYGMTYTAIQTPAAQLLSKAITWDGQFCQGKGALIAKMTTGKYYYCPKP